MSVVSFLVAGVPKGGTTALARYLQQHPQLWLPEEKGLRRACLEAVCVIRGGGPT